MLIFYVNWIYIYIYIYQKDNDGGGRRGVKGRSHIREEERRKRII